MAAEADEGAVVVKGFAAKYADAWAQDAEPLYEVVQELVELYHQRSEEMWNAGPVAQRPRFRPSVRRGRYGPIIYWQQRRFKTGADGKKFARWETIGRRRHPTRYPPGLFKEAPAWEQEVIAAVEDVFEKVRQYTAIMQACHARLLGAEKLRQYLLGTSAEPVMDGEADSVGEAPEALA